MYYNRNYNNCIVLTPIEKHKVGAKALWVVKCFCGNKFNARPDNLNSGNTKSCGCLNLKHIQSQAYNWKDLIFNNCKILSPVNKNKIGGDYKWNILCYCGNIFQSRPSHLKLGTTRSCGCYKKAEHRARYAKYKHQKHITKNQIFRMRYFNPIKKLILKVDNYKCQLCNNVKKNKLSVHHIIPISHKINSIQLHFELYDINNLITLCNDCHIMNAHNGSFSCINIEVQKELLEKTKNRNNLSIVDEYNKIINSVKD